MEKEMPEFSPREREVIALVLQGKSNKQVAFRLNISVRTVEFHLKNIYAKQQVGSRVELILALERASFVPKTENLGESTVDRRREKVHNGNLTALAHSWEATLKIILSLVQKELAMTEILLLEKIENLVKRHPLLLSMLLLLIVSFTTRYLLIVLGLYFELSYILLALILSIGSVYLGLSLHKIDAGRLRFQALAMLGIALLPIGIALLDVSLLYTVAKITGEASIDLVNISNKALWLIAPGGQPYLYRERFLRNDHLWLFVTLYMFLLFGMSVFVREIKRSQTIAA
jgi:DNA-binding CsgD family transcriptional regulator